VQAHLTQEHSYLTASSTFARRVSSIVAQFLVRPDGPTAQLRHLRFVQKLWGVMKNVFSGSWLSPPAEIILSAVLKVNFTLADEDVQLAWSQLCADLISVGVPTLLHIVSIRSGRTEGLQVTRQLWTVLAKALQSPDDYVHWDDVLCSLVIPLK
jgi:flagellar biosynthesis regulator FlaF